jgi:hypothetical protein
MKPMNRVDMQQLKEKYDEGNRIQFINQTVTNIYSMALAHARSKTDKSYNYSINQQPLIVKHMPDILIKLQELFPDCSITHTLMARGSDGKMYDISKIDDSILHLINSVNKESYIVIDWS